MSASVPVSPSQVRSPIGELWSLAWPTVLTMTSFTLMQFTDKLMVGRVGPLEVAAQGNGQIWSFTPIALALGVLTMVNTFAAQNLGAGRPRAAPRYAFAALWLGLAYWAVVLVPLAFALPWIFEAMIDAERIEQADRLLALQTEYARILLLGAFVTMAGRTMHQTFFGLHRPRLIAVSAFAGNAVNVLANYVLIFGEAGLPSAGLPGIPGTPALGLTGAALGTILGTTVEVAIPLAVFLGPRMHAELDTRRQWRPCRRAMRDLLRVGWPASLQWGNEIVCWAIFMTLLVGHFGADHMAAGWIVLGYMHLSFMPAVGMSTAVTSIVGKYIGAGDPDTAAARTRLGVWLTVAYMTVWALAFVVFRHPLVALFVGGDVTPEAAERIVAIGGKLLICAAVFQTADAVGITYSGGLRGAGDTVWPGVMTFVYSWLFIVAGGLALVWWWPELESLGPWIAAAAYIVVLGLTLGWRFESGRWRSIRLLEGSEPASEEAPVAVAAG